MDLEPIKRRFGIIGNNSLLNHSLETALRVAPTDLSVLITGESGVGKETIPQIIHQSSHRKHNKYIAVNCGAIPEGTMDSELFGHVKGSFTGAHAERKGYFEEADGGTLFLDEIAEMPMSTQVKLLRLLESGEFLKVGSSNILKTNVRIVAATNVNVLQAIDKGRFREDLYYRLNTVPIVLPPLRDRKEDVELLFRKFAQDFAEKYKMPVIRLEPDAREVLLRYNWPGNIRQLKNITEQISILETSRQVTGETLVSYLPGYSQSKLPVLARVEGSVLPDEKEILYQVIKEMRRELDQLKAIIQAGFSTPEDISGKVLSPNDEMETPYTIDSQLPLVRAKLDAERRKYGEAEVVEESLSLQDKEKELISKALEKHRGKRKYAAIDLGISERTLYRKIKEYDL